MLALSLTSAVRGRSFGWSKRTLFIFDLVHPSGKRSAALLAMDKDDLSACCNASVSGCAAMSEVVDVWGPRLEMLPGLRLGSADPACESLGWFCGVTLRCRPLRSSAGLCESCACPSPVETVLSAISSGALSSSNGSLLAVTKEAPEGFLFVPVFGLEGPWLMLLLLGVVLVGFCSCAVVKDTVRLTGGLRGSGLFTSAGTGSRISDSVWQETWPL